MSYIKVELLDIVSVLEAELRSYVSNNRSPNQYIIGKRQGIIDRLYALSEQIKFNPNFVLLNKISSLMSDVNAIDEDINSYTINITTQRREIVRRAYLNL